VTSESRPWGRLVWRIEDGATRATLDVRPRLIRTVDIFIDGRRVLAMPKPTRGRPWVTAVVSVPPVGDYTVALTRRGPDMHVEVFTGGHSLVDGRTLEAARAEAPAPMDLYARETDLNITSVASSRLFPAWVVAGAGFAVLTLVAGLALRVGVLAAALIAIGSVVGLVLFIRTWLVCIAKTHGRLLHNPRPPAVRLAILLAVIVAPAVLVVGAALLLILLAGGV
jgi:hypothetical protein